MKQALCGAVIAFLIAASVCLVTITARVDRLLDHADAAVIEAKTATGQASNDLHGSVQNLNAILLQAGLATDEARRAATEQRKYWNLTAEQTDKTVRAFRQLVDRTDRQLNDTLLPNLSDQFEATSATAQASLSAVTQSADALTARLNDPNITSLALHLDQTAANVEIATGHLANASADVEKKVHQLTKPASFAVRVGKALLGVAAQVGAMMGGLK